MVTFQHMMNFHHSNKPVKIELAHAQAPFWSHKIPLDFDIDIQFGEIVGHGVWLIGPKLFRPKA